jgi:hypothetical protein
LAFWVLVTIATCCWCVLSIKEKPASNILTLTVVFLFLVVLQTNAGHSLLIIEVPRSQTTTHQLVGLLWASDQLVTETSTWQHTTLITDRHPCPSGIRTHNLSKWEAADLRLRPHGHWDRHTRNSVLTVQAVWDVMLCCWVSGTKGF